jgi:hypothetical protein
MQKNSAVFLGKSPEMAAIPQILLSNWTGESVRVYLAGEMYGSFL